MQYLTESEVRQLAEHERAKHLLAIAALLAVLLAAFVRFVSPLCVAGVSPEGRRNRGGPQSRAVQPRT